MTDERSLRCSSLCGGTGTIIKTSWQLEKTLNKVCLGPNLSQFLSRYAIYAVWQPLRSDYRINCLKPECEMIQLKS